MAHSKKAKKRIVFSGRGAGNDRVINLDLQDKFTRLKGREYNIISAKSTQHNEIMNEKSSTHYQKSKSSLGFYNQNQYPARNNGGFTMNQVMKSSNTDMADQIFKNESWFRNLTKKRNTHDQYT